MTLPAQQSHNATASPASDRSDNFFRVFRVFRGQPFRMPPLYDAHNHLQDEWLAPHLDQVAWDLTGEGIAGAVVNGTSPDDWPAVSELASRFSWVIPSYGVHPWDCGNRPADWKKRLRDALAEADSILMDRDQVGLPRGLSPVASAKGEALAKVGLPAVGLAKVGEIGLDRWILDRAKPDDPRLEGLRRAPLEEQLEVFIWQLELAAAQDRAASIHCIDAWGALYDSLRKSRRPSQGFLLHAYAGPKEMVKPFADLGAYFSFNGSYLDPKRVNQRETFKSVPRDRLLIETDAPAMPLRSKWKRHELPSHPDSTSINHPANISGVYAGLADFLGHPIDQLTQQVEQNFHALFTSQKV